MFSTVTLSTSEQSQQTHRSSQPAATCVCVCMCIRVSVWERERKEEEGSFCCFFFLVEIKDRSRTWFKKSDLKLSVGSVLSATSRIIWKLSQFSQPNTPNALWPIEEFVFVFPIKEVVVKNACFLYSYDDIMNSTICCDRRHHHCSTDTTPLEQNSCSVQRRKLWKRETESWRDIGCDDKVYLWLNNYGNRTQKNELCVW